VAASTAARRRDFFILTSFVKVDLDFWPRNARAIFLCQAQYIRELPRKTFKARECSSPDKPGIIAEIAKSCQFSVAMHHPENAQGDG
jgi:hypothetical protein